jgi:hypothetical protein
MKETTEVVETIEEISSNAEISDAYGSERVDVIASNKVSLLRDATAARVEFIKESNENRQAVMDYIFGVSEDNPLKSITDEVNDKLQEYEDRIAKISRGIKVYMRVNKLNV